VTRPIVAIVGRHNVGKSTLLNRLAGKRIAIVDDLAGTTRDRILATVSALGREFTLVDTGGLELKPESSIARGINEQIAAAISEADVIIFLTDAGDGVTPADLEIHGVRTEQHKYTFGPQNDELPQELYDLQADPGETRNLAGEPAYADVVVELSGLVRRYANGHLPR